MCNLPVQPLHHTFEEAKAIADNLHEEARRYGAVLEAFPRSGPFNLITDEARYSPEFMKAQKDYDRAFSRLRNFNAVYTKKFAKEIRADRDAQRQAKLQSLQSNG